MGVPQEVSSCISLVLLHLNGVIFQCTQVLVYPFEGLGFGQGCAALAEVEALRAQKMYDIPLRLEILFDFVEFPGICGLFWVNVGRIRKIIVFKIVRSVGKGQFQDQVLRFLVPALKKVCLPFYFRKQ